MNDLHRLQQLIDELFKGNQAAFSRAIHRQPAQVSQYLRERRQVGVEIKQHIEKALGLAGWFDGARPKWKRPAPVLTSRDELDAGRSGVDA